MSLGISVVHGYLKDCWKNHYTFIINSLIFIGDPFGNYLWYLYEVHHFSCPEEGDDPMNTECSLATEVAMNGMEEMCQYPYGNWDGREERKEKHSDSIANFFFQIEIIGFKGIYF